MGGEIDWLRLRRLRYYDPSVALAGDTTMSWLLAGFMLLLGFFLGTIAAEVYDMMHLK